MSDAPNVLIVEDSPTMRGLITFALRRRFPQATITEADNGLVALGLIEERTFDIILLDLNMPVMNGFAFLEKIGAKAGPRPPIVMVTTEGADDDIARAMRLGAVAYVTKPIKAIELASTVMRVLGGS
jgi:two-component system chemotaxis response regulator CheY